MAGFLATDGKTWWWILETLFSNNTVTNIELQKICTCKGAGILKLTHLKHKTNILKPSTQLFRFWSQKMSDIRSIKEPGLHHPRWQRPCTNRGTPRCRKSKADIAGSMRTSQTSQQGYSFQIRLAISKAKVNGLINVWFSSFCRSNPKSWSWTPHSHAQSP